MSDATRLQEKSVARLSLLGPVRLTDLAGRDRTPRGAQQQAILAVVALSGDMGVARARLQDMFWGERSQVRAAQSLRTALHGLRRSVETFGAPLIEIDASRVRLVPGAVAVDVLEIARDGVAAIPAPARANPPDLLEGADIPAEPFEEWLRDQRSHWQGRIAELLNNAAKMPAQVAPPPHAASEDTRPIVGLLEPVIRSKSLHALFLGEALLDRIAVSLREYAGARTFDYRDLTEGEAASSVPHVDPQLYLRLRLYEAGDTLSVRLLVLRHSTHELLWSVQGGPFPVDRARIESAEMLAFLGETVDRIATALAQLPHRGAGAPLSPFHVLTSMFQLDHGSLDDLRKALDRSQEETGDPIYAALLAYLNSFRVGEHWSGVDGRLEEETRDLIARVEDWGPGDGIALGLAGHATGYILHDHNDAHDLLDRAIRMAPHSAFCWDHMALHNIYIGRYDRARDSSQTALRLAESSPIRFTIETTRCMIATLEGDFRAACDLGKRALARRPNFGAALRYTSVSLAHLGDTDGAADVVRRIRRMDPTFSVTWVDEDRMAVRDGVAKAILRDGLIRAGAR